MVYCSVRGCKTSQKYAKEQGIQMFRFPRDPVFIRQWIHACRKPWPLNTVTARICSLHFTQDSYCKPLMHTLLNYTPKRYRSLKPDAVPTENLPRSTKPLPRSKNVPESLPESSVQAVVIKIEVEDTIVSETDSYSRVEVGDDNYHAINNVITEYGDNGSRGVISDVVPNETVTSAADETSFAEGTHDSNREHVEKPLTRSDAKWKTEVGMLCRLCSKSDFNCIPIFRGKGETLELGTKIPRYLQIEVQPGDKLPDQVCRMCLEAICAWDEYVQSCVTADKKLKELLLDEDEVPTVLKQNKKSSAPEQKLRLVNNQNLAVVMQNLVTMKQNVAPQKIKVVDQSTLARKKNTHDKNAVGTKMSKINISSEKMRNKLVKGSASVNVTQTRNNGNETEHLDSDDVFQDDYVNDDENIGQASGSNKEEDNWFKEGQFKGEKVYKCGICCTPFFNYLQCVAHKMAAHPKRVKPTLVEETEMSDSNIEESSSLQDINVSVSKNNQKENSTDRLKENANKENFNPEGSSNFKCSVCATDFSNYLSLAAHRMAAHASHKCDVCFQTFPSGRVLIKHMVVKHKSMSERMEPKTCPVCSQQIEACNLNKHLRSHPGLCVKCYKIIPNEKEFEEHKLFHVKDYKCHTCGRAFKTSTNLKFHSETHLPDSVAKRFKCPKCDVAFRWEASVKRHYEVKHATNVSSVLCHICCKTFSCERYFKVHMRQVHPTASPLQCEVCGKFFKSKKYLIRHMVCHLPSNKKPVIRTSKDRTYDVKCEKCGRFFASRTGLTLHSRKDCTSTESRMCYICGLILETSVEFQKHLIKHKSRPFQCIYCDRSFRTEAAKTTHTYKHTGERPYVCVVCDKRFLSKYHLLLHSTMHSNTKPFECHFCDKKFRHKINLSQHVLSHTNDRRYKCDMCGRAFIQLCHLKMHKRKHYKTLPCFDTASER